jgi:hypothetical protein
MVPAFEDDLKAVHRMLVEAQNKAAIMNLGMANVPEKDRDEDWKLVREFFNELVSSIFNLDQKVLFWIQSHEIEKAKEKK